MSKKLGGWSAYQLVSTLTEEQNKLQLEIIKCAQPHLLGAHWEAILISTQIVSGANFKIVYLVSTVSMVPAQSLVEVTGFRALDGTCSIASRKVIAELTTAQHLLGAWSVYRVIDKSEQEIFVEANNLGVSRKPFLASNQIVNGINYCFVSLAQVPGPDNNNPQYIDCLTAHKPFNGKAVFKNVEQLGKNLEA